MKKILLRRVQDTYGGYGVCMKEINGRRLLLHQKSTCIHAYVNSSFIQSLTPIPYHAVKIYPVLIENP